MSDDKLHPLRTGDGEYHSAASHDSKPQLFHDRMDVYRRRVKEETQWHKVTPIAKRKAAP